MKKQKTHEKHGLSKTRLYRCWENMKKRCKNPNSSYYEKYGGRGITYCKEWESFVNFYNWAMDNGYNDELSIDRIDVNGNYCPENCRWVNAKIQMNNTTRNHYVEYQGRMITVAQLAEISGINYRTLLSRIQNNGGFDEKLLSSRISSKRQSQIECFGEIHTYAEWSRITGIGKTTLRYRISECGIPPELALTAKPDSARTLRERNVKTVREE